MAAETTGTRHARAKVYRAIENEIRSFGAFRRCRRDFVFDSGKQFGKGYSESLRNGERRLDREVMFAALDAAHVCPMEAAMVGEGLLGKALLPPQFPYPVPEDYCNLLHLQQFADRH